LAQAWALAKGWRGRRGTAACLSCIADERFSCHSLSAPHFGRWRSVCRRVSQMRRERLGARRRLHRGAQRHRARYRATGGLCTRLAAGATSQPAHEVVLALPLAVALSEACGLEALATKASSPLQARCMAAGPLVRCPRACLGRRGRSWHRQPRRRRSLPHL